MYVGVLSILAGESLWFWSTSLAQYALIVFLMFHLVVIIYEEGALAAKFGDSYRKYRATTPRWLPRMKV
jgi:protein-S-isoprenylcysteine O-methyltransferase Ste14